MTIYIAGPMTGLPYFNRAAFNNKEAELVDAGYNVLNPARIGDLPEYDMYWPINKAMLDGADSIYMLDGWEDSKGAKKELFYAIELGLSVLFESPEIIGRFLDYRMHSIGVSALPNCNDCGRKTCNIVPTPGTFARINCPHWEARA